MNNHENADRQGGYMSVPDNGNGHHGNNSVPTIYLRQPADAGDSESSNGFTPRFVLQTFSRWWKTVLLVGAVLVAICVGVMWYVFTPSYRAAAWIRIADQTPYIAYRDPEDNETTERFVETQIELIQSSLVLDPAVRRAEVARLPLIQQMADPAETLAERVRVVQVGKSELYEVAFEAPDPESAAHVVNAVVDAYFDLQTEHEVERTQRVLDLLDRERLRRSQEVQRRRQQILKKGQEIDPLAGNLASSATVGNRPFAADQESLAAAEVNAKILEIEIKAAEEAIQSGKDVTVPEVLVDLEVQNVPEIQGEKAALLQKRASLSEIANVAAKGKEDPSYKRVMREIEQQEKRLQQSIEEQRPVVRAKLIELEKLRRQDEIARMRVELQSAQAREQLLRGRYEQQLALVGKSGDKSLELAQLQAELTREEAVFDMIAERATALRTEMGAPHRISRMKRAEPPKVPEELLPWKQIAIGVFLCLCFPFGIVLLWERRIQRINDSDQLQHRLAVPVVAEIAELPERAPNRRNRLANRGAGKAMNLVEESVDGLRSSLVLPASGKQLQVLALASAVQGEGKTTVAAQLVVSVARATGQRALLIDADMRAPDVHRIFDIPLEPGLCKVLDGACDLDDALVTLWSEHVHFLPAGKLHRSPHKLLGNGAIESLLDELRKEYHFIVIDTPPILAANEALVLARAADATVVCAMRSRSRERQLKMALGRLAAADVKPAGIVLNAVPTSHYESTYGSYAPKAF